MSNKEYYSYSKILYLVEEAISYAKQYISMKRYVSIYSYALSTQTKSIGLMSRHVYATLERKISNIVKHFRL